MDEGSAVSRKSINPIPKRFFLVVPQMTTANGFSFRFVIKCVASSSSWTAYNHTQSQPHTTTREIINDCHPSFIFPLPLFSLSLPLSPPLSFHLDVEANLGDLGRNRFLRNGRDANRGGGRGEEEKERPTALTRTHLRPQFETPRKA